MAYQLREITSSTLGVVDAKYSCEYDGTYWWIGGDDNAAGDLFLASFDGTTITLLDALILNDDFWDLVYDGAYIHAATSEGAGELRAYSRTGTTINAVIDSVNFTSVCHAVAYDGAYIYAGDDSGNVHALSFNGIAYTLHDTLGLGAIDVDQLLCAGGAIFAACDNGIVYGLSFDGANLSNDGNTGVIMSNNCRALAHDGTYLHVGGANAAAGDADIEAFTYAGGVFTAAGTIDTTANVYRLRHDGTYLHAACSDGTLRSYTHNGAAYTQAASVVLSAGNVLEGLGYNSTYMLVGCHDNSVYAVQMSLKANITATPRSGIAPLAVNFTAS